MAENVTSKVEATSADSEAVSASELDAGDAMEESLDAEWRGLWLDLKCVCHHPSGCRYACVTRSVVLASFLASWMDAVGRRRALSPRVMLRDVIQHFENPTMRILQMGPHRRGGAGSFPGGSSAGKPQRRRCLRRFLNRVKPSQMPRRKRQGLEASWVLSSWAHNADWKDRSPEQVQALPAWPSRCSRSSKTSAFNGHNGRSANCGRKRGVALNRGARGPDDVEDRSQPE